MKNKKYFLKKRIFIDWCSIILLLSQNNNIKFQKWEKVNLLEVFILEGGDEKKEKEIFCLFLII